MQPQATNVTVRDAAGAQTIIQEALRIVSEEEIDDDLRVAVFEKACDLLAAGSLVVAQPQPLDLGSLDLSNGRRL